jgi:hypothetical protein
MGRPTLLPSLHFRVMAIGFVEGLLASPWAAELRPRHLRLVDISSIIVISSSGNANTSTIVHLLIFLPYYQFPATIPHYLEVQAVFQNCARSRGSNESYHLRSRDLAIKHLQLHCRLE